MSNIELLKYIRLLRDKANSNKLIVFVGAGVSCNVEGMPDWNILIEKMAEAIKYTRCSSCKGKIENCHETCRLKDSFSSDDYLKIPQYVYNKNKKQYNQVIMDNIRDVDIDAPLSNAIVELEPSHIITTNYDKLIENCRAAKQDNFDVIVNDKGLLKSEKNKYIIKMHGDIKDVDTIVLKESDYLEYSQKHVLIEMFVKSLLTDHTILFLGYSLNDYNIKLIISWINYIRNQNKALDTDTKFGYIVVDSAKMTSDQKRYFKNNNIEVINIHKMPLMVKIPESLTNDIGKRLYSFLKTIKDFSLELNLGQELIYENAVTFMHNYNYIDYRNICKILSLGICNRNGSNLKIHSNSNYDALVRFLESETENAKYLKQVFVDAGIELLEPLSQTANKCFYKINGNEKTLFNDGLYQLYLNNKYNDLMCACKKEDVFRGCFYSSIVQGYTVGLYEQYDGIQYNELPEERKVVYLFNNAALKAKKTYRYETYRYEVEKISGYINGIADTQRREMMRFYLDIQDGNTDKLLKMRESLEKLREQYSNRKNSFVGCSSLQELYNIKNIAIEQYMLYFYNTLFYEGFSDLKKALRSYIEAILCTNGQFDEEENGLQIGNSKKERYAIDKCDVDIMTKFISIKELYNMINEYEVDKFNAEEEIIDFIIECFENISNSTITLQLYNQYYNASRTLINCMLILSHFELSDIQREKVSLIIRLLLKSEDFIEFFFSIECPEWRLSMRILNNLLQGLTVEHDFEIIKEIINRENFWNYYANVNMYELRTLLDKFLSCEKIEEIQTELNEFIGAFDGRKRIDVIKLLRNNITEENSIIHKSYIAEHYDDLDTQDIFDFSFSDWLILSNDKINKLITETIQIYEEQKSSPYRVTPDPLASNMELIIVFYITGEINDLTKLEVMKENNVFLQFFLDPYNFDYEQVDFSHYMWENIARRQQFMEKIVEHKESVIPKIQKRIQIGSATELEKKILYGYLLAKDELL